MAATEAQDVYPLNNLIPNDLLNSIDVNDWVEKHKKHESIQTRSKYVSRRLQSVLSNNDITKTRVLRYMLVAIEFYLNLKGGRLPKRVPARKELNDKIKFSPALVEAIRKRFCIAS
jgi:DNA-directed RNA polymerase I subunit RPA49